MLLGDVGVVVEKLLQRQPGNALEGDDRNGRRPYRTAGIDADHGVAAGGFDGEPGAQVGVGCIHPREYITQIQLIIIPERETVVCPLLFGEYILDNPMNQAHTSSTFKDQTMTYALIIAEKPVRGWPDSMYHAIHKMPTAENFEKLNEGSWLVSLDTHLIFLSVIVQICQKESIAHRVAFFEQKPSFTSAPFEFVHTQPEQN